MPLPRWAGLRACATLLIVPLLGTAQLPPRDSRPSTPTGDSTITGRVMTSEGRPLARARVMLRGAAGPGGNTQIVISNGVPSGPNFWQQVTDANGQFTFDKIPAGAYLLSASHNRYLSAQYGQQYVGQPGRLIELGAGERLRADLVAVRGGAITGRVFDETGEPLSDVSVQVYRYVVDGQTRQLMPAGGRAYASNDIGQYRIANLAPGDYVVAAQLRGEVLPDQGATGIREGYAATYYPGTPSPESAQTIRVSPGNDAANIDFVLQPTRMVQASGVILTASGQPASNTQVWVTPIGSGLVATPTRPIARVLQNGTFIVSDLTPGDYLFKAQYSAPFQRPQPGAPGAGGPPPMPRRDMEYGSLRVSVGPYPIEGLTLQLRPGARITARIQSDAPLTGRQMLILTPDEPGSTSLAVPLMSGDPGLSNTGPGKYRPAIAGLPEGWVLDRIMNGARDITDEGIVVRDSSPVDLVLHVTSRGAVITGTATAPGASAPPADYTVVVLPEKHAERSLAAQSVKVARPDQRGGFVVRGLRAGTYFVAALEYADPNQLYNPAFWARVEPNAIRVTVSAGETRQVTAPFISRR